MKKQFTIGYNGTALSHTHAEMLKNIILLHFPAISISIVDNHGTDTDFETHHYPNILVNGRPTLHAAHIHQTDSRNTAIFNKNIEDKIASGATLHIAIDPSLSKTSIHNFLQKGLPQLNKPNITIAFVPIESDKLLPFQHQEIDGCIVPLAYVCQLENSTLFKDAIATMLASKKWMVLPIFECPPMLGQGVLMASSKCKDEDAVTILNTCNNITIENHINSLLVIKNVLPEISLHGAFHLQNLTTSFSFLTGNNAAGKACTHWNFDLPKQLQTKITFSSTDFMKDFFSYRLLPDVSIDTGVKAVFVSSHKAIHSEQLLRSIQHIKVWVAGTRTWYELAKKGVWIEGGADGLGLESLHEIWLQPIVALNNSNIQIITNVSSAVHWAADNWKAIGTYVLEPTADINIIKSIGNAQFIFWTSYQQYEQYKFYVNEPVIHGCPSGKTAKLLEAAGVSPIIFPTIKSFLFWRNHPTNTS